MILENAHHKKLIPIVVTFLRELGYITLTLVANSTVFGACASQRGQEGVSERPLVWVPVS